VWPTLPTASVRITLDARPPLCLRILYCYTGHMSKRGDTESTGDQPEQEGGGRHRARTELPKSQPVGNQDPAKRGLGLAGTPQDYDR